ncbi:MAG: ATP-dependent protease, Lon family, partial [Candidatus Eremiobacteraeota bacterium]|nr:ATP-dependent protease, Lon family [Candidatus Eremiobacteraeota bacterium]
YSALTKTRLPQDVVVTGEVSISGKVRAVGGIVEKMYAARQAGMRLALIPKENERDVRGQSGTLEIVPVATVEEALAVFDVAMRKRGR